MAEKRITVYVLRPSDRGILQLQWVDPDTGRRKTQSAGTTDAKEADIRAADLEADLNAGRHKETSRMAWGTFRELFEAEYVAARRQNTRENYQAMLDIFERLCHPASLRGITERTLSTFAAGLRKEPGRARGSTGQAPSTIKQRLALLRTALRWAAGQKLIPTVPNFPGVKVPKKKPQPIPAESFERLLSRAPDDNMRAYLLAGWLGGLRLAEAAALEWDQADNAPYLDPDRSRIVLPAEFAKSDEDQWVPLDPVLWEAIRALPRHGRKVFDFTAKDGHTISLSGIGERVIRLARKAGVRLSMHSLRKGFGCRYAGRVSAQVLQKLMRHANIATTMAFYANVDDAVMNAVLGGKPNDLPNTAGTEVQAIGNDATQGEGANGVQGTGGVSGSGLLYLK
jgi:integrase